MKKRGEITVFLSMVLVCIFALICVMLESARTAGARYYLQTAANSSVDSLLSGYHRQLWEQYHLLFLECESSVEVAEDYEKYLKPYFETENWYPMEITEVQAEEPVRATDAGGRYLEQEILEYMKYGIWSRLEIVPDQAEEQWKRIKEAESMQKLTDSYGKQSRAAWKLEQKLEQIYDCIRSQKEEWNQAGEALSAQESSNFFRQATQLKTKIKKIPRLIKIYEKQADRLRTEVDEMSQSLVNRRADLSPEMQRVMEEELEEYCSYVAQDGKRRSEIMRLISVGDQNLMLIADTEESVGQIGEYIESLEENSGEEEEDHSDEIRQMWEEVLDQWESYTHNPIPDVGEKQEEKRIWLEQIQIMMNGELLGLFLPEDTKVSEVRLSLEDAPSKMQERTGETDGKNLRNRVLVNEYCDMHFSDFQKTDSNKTGENPPGVRYELEYLLGGKESDRKNLEGTVQKLLSVREGLNLTHILSNRQKREESKALALLITGAVGLAPLVEITAFLIMNIWALGEAIADVRALLADCKIPILKRPQDWNLSLEQLLIMGREGQRPQAENHALGLGYRGYLKLLLLLEGSEQKYYRMMDLMQMRMRQKQADFEMIFCAYRVDIKVEVCGKHVFFALPMVDNLTGNKDSLYVDVVKTPKAY